MDRPDGPHRVARRAFLAATLALGACAVPGFRDPPSLYTLTPATRFPEGLPQVRQQLLIEMPVANAGLDTSRVALRTAPTSLDYYARANWTDRAPAMVQTLIVQSFENTGRIVSVGRDTVGLRADWLLKTDLRDFQAEYDGSTAGVAPDVRVRLNAKLVAMPRRTIEASETFEALVRADGTSFEAAIEAYDRALGDVLSRMTAWTLLALAGAQS